MQLQHAIWWQVYPLGFAGAPIRDWSPSEAVAAHGTESDDARATEAGSEYGAEHDEQRAGTVGGADGLRRLSGWLDYLVELGANGLLLGPVFVSSTHGYDTLDHLHVDPRLGTDDDLDALIAAARERGVGILLDGVFNHVGREHPAYQQALADGAGSPAAEAFKLDWVDGRPQPRVFEGHGDLVELNLATDAGRELVTGIMCHWLERGIAGWRLDAAYSVPAEQWRPILDAVRQRYPEALFVGEVIHGDYAGIVAASGMDSITQYELWKAIWSSLKDANFYELAHALGRHDALLDSVLPMTFIGNHDVSRIASVIGPDKAALALVVLLTVGGSPCLYYGDEQGWVGIKEERLGGDDAVRPEYPATPAVLAERDPAGAEVLALHRGLIGLRRRHPWLSTARTQVRELTNERLVYRAQAAVSGGAAGQQDDQQWIDVELDLTAERPRARISGPEGELWVVQG